jgi:hypothetical protein
MSAPTTCTAKPCVLAVRIGHDVGVAAGTAVGADPVPNELDPFGQLRIVPSEQTLLAGAPEQRPQRVPFGAVRARRAVGPSSHGGDGGCTGSGGGMLRRCAASLALLVLTGCSGQQVLTLNIRRRARGAASEHPARRPSASRSATRRAPWSRRSAWRRGRRSASTICVRWCSIWTCLTRISTR